MKKNLLATVAYSLAVLVGGCSSYDTPDTPSPTVLSPVHFNVSCAGMEGVDTRSLAEGYKFADGASISVIKCYIYNQKNGSSASPVKVLDIDVESVNGHPGGEFTVMLPKGQSFDAVFIATSIDHNNTSSKLYYSQSARELKVNYTSVFSNDEELDCFYAVQKDISSESATECSVVLRRPFAQLNIGTKDYGEYSATHNVSGIQVSVDGICSTLRVMTGMAVGSSKVTFKAAQLPSGQSFPIEGYTYLAMNYLLVDTRTQVDVVMDVKNTGGSSKTVKIGKATVERNYQTNIYGEKLLTDFSSK